MACFPPHSHHTSKLNSTASEHQKQVQKADSRKLGSCE